MNGERFSNQVWRKSSYSGATGSCIEVMGDMLGHIFVRDSKNRGGPELTIAFTEWLRFVRQLKATDKPRI